MESKPEIDALLNEARTFPPPACVAANAPSRTIPAIYARAAADPEAFWADFARELEWIEPWKTVLEWKSPHAKWFVGGKLNASANCLDRHVRTARRNKAAIIWEGEPGDRRTLTYFDLYREVCRFANVLKSLGVRKGDRVALYLPLIPELAIAMLACARIGAVHSVVFGGFSAESLRDRINDAQATVLVTADGGYPSRPDRAAEADGRRGAARDALDQARRRRAPPGRRPGGGRPVRPDLREPRSLVPRADAGRRRSRVRPSRWTRRTCCTSSTRPARPESRRASSTRPAATSSATYATTKWVFDLREEDVYWCTADIGWVTGHSYVVYGPLANGATVLMYEGAPDWPAKDRFWSLIERHGVTIFYTAPTAIRAFMKWGTEWPARRDLSSLRLLGSVGEPINPEAWIWYQQNIGRDRCPVVDTWWQTETGHILITPLPGLTTLKPGSATKPFPGIAAEIRTADGKRVSEGGGLLALTKPWPGMLRGIYGDPERFVQQYWSKWKDGVYFTGDGARVDEDGDYWLLGRVDDVLNVAGHRIGTMEVESALVDHPKVAEAAVVGRPHEIKGQAVAAFVTLKEGATASPALVDELKEHVVRKIGALARPDQILFAADLPKTRSGKIMRRLLRDIAEGKTLGDTTTLADPNVIARLKDEYESLES